MAPLTQCFPWRMTELPNLILRIFCCWGEERAEGVFPAGSAAPAAEHPKQIPRQQVPAPASPYMTLGQGLALGAPRLPHVWKGDNSLAFMRSWE